MDAGRQNPPPEDLSGTPRRTQPSPTDRQVEAHKLKRVVRALATQQSAPLSGAMRVRHLQGQRYAGATTISARLPAAAMRGQMRDIDPWWHDTPVARNPDAADLTEDRRVDAGSARPDAVEGGPAGAPALGHPGTESTLFQLDTQERTVTLLDGTTITTIRDVFYDTGTRQHSKVLTIRREDGSIVGYNRVPKYLMPLDGIDDVRLQRDATIVVVEGYPAAERLRARAIDAVGIIGGTLHVPSDRALDPLLKAGRIILWPDNDSAGLTLMARVAKSLMRMGGDGINIGLVRWRGGPRKGDAFDFDGDDAELAALLESAVPWTASTRVSEGTITRVKVARGPMRLSLPVGHRPPQPEIVTSSGRAAFIEGSDPDGDHDGGVDDSLANPVAGGFDAGERNTARHGGLDSGRRI